MAEAAYNSVPEDLRLHIPPKAHTEQPADFRSGLIGVFKKGHKGAQAKVELCVSLENPKQNEGPV